LAAVSEFRWRAAIAAVLALILTGAALSIALVAAADARARSHELPGRLAGARAAQRAWLARVAAPQLNAAASGDFGRAQALQADIPLVRPYVVAVRSRMALLQAQITAMQGRITSRISKQHILLAALIAVCVVVAVIVAGGVIAVRRWLLRPFLALRQATDAVAAGHYDTTVPAVGPAELADLGRSVELMRIRLVDALATAESAEQGFRGLFESAPDATLTVGGDGSILMANAQAQRLFRYDAGELVGQPVEVLVPAGTRAAHPRLRDGYFADPNPRPMGVGLELSAVTKDGHLIPVEISLSTFPAARGMVATASIRDISDRLAIHEERDRLRAEAERERYTSRLQQSERLESLGQLVGGVAHDFNNLLNVIAGYNEFTAQELGQYAPEDQRIAAVLEDVGQIREATARATRLTRQLLTFAHRDVVHPEVLDLSHVVAGVDQLLRRTLGEHVELVISPGGGTWRVKADVGQLEQVVVNLAINARDAMPSGGKLTIDTDNIEADEAYAASRPDLKPGRYARLRMSDTGTGMEPEVLARVLEPFYSTKPTGKGTGLGLSTVYGIVTRAGGSLHIHSEPGLGTTVSALLPATDEEADAAETVISAVPAPGRGETILLAEDEKSLRELTRRILTRNGYRVCATTSPADAIQQAQAQDQRIDLLLTDVVMPDMLGNELADRVAAIRPGIPVLYMSGYAQAMLDTQGALDGRIDLLEKPFTEKTVLSRIREALDARCLPGPIRRLPGGGGALDIRL
jgi:PAS domain S-box-containing protein